MTVAIRSSGSSARSRTADVGDTSRPSVNAWIHVFSGAKREQRLQVVDVRMDAAVRDEAQQVHALAALERARQHRALEERAVLDRLVHAHQVLVEPAAGADRQVADLAVPHLAGWQARRLARGLDRRVRELAPERSKTGVSASSTAFPGPGGAQPQPSRMTRATR